jgi:hypothetical protein
VNNIKYLMLAGLLGLTLGAAPAMAQAESGPGRNTDTGYTNGGPSGGGPPLPGLPSNPSLPQLPGLPQPPGSPHAATGGGYGVTGNGG